ncbi:MAG TPA: hypothetical protein VF163_00040, partial [Micromonosporaceae bacterium]
MRKRTSRMRADVLVALGVLAVVALAMAAPRFETNKIASSPTPASSLGLDGCPMPGTSPEPDAAHDRDGAFIPTGAVRVTLCQTVIDPTDPRVHSRLAVSRVLYDSVPQLIDQLNSMPSIAGLKWIGQGTGVRPPQPRADQFSCVDRNRATTDLSLVLRYPSRAPVVVWLDRNCGSATYDGRTRYGLRQTLAVFFALIRAQRAALAEPRDLRALACPASMSAAELDRRTLVGQGRDDIAEVRSDGDPFLPSPVAAVTLCRYVEGTGGMALRSSRTATLTATVAPLAYAVNSQLTNAAVYG